MPEHYPKSTVEASIWCLKCRKMTPWRVADGRRQYCLPCYELAAQKKPAAKPAEEPPAEQLGLF